MKTWLNPEIKEVAFGCTQYGGTPNNAIDQHYQDQNHEMIVNFEPDKWS